MAVKLTWHPRASEDLLLIYEFIGLDNPDAAERLITTIEIKVELLVRYPRLGTRRPEIRRTTRILLEGPYLILYQTHPDTDEGPIREVEIVRIVDGRRDLTRPF
jgi:toxin ParE1/3/4